MDLILQPCHLFLTIFGLWLNWKKYLLMDRDTKVNKAFREILSDAGVQAVVLPPRSPNMNAFIERFMRTLKSECLNRMIFFGESSVRRAVKSDLEHYHAELNHQGIGNDLIEPEKTKARDVVAGKIECREQVGGMLKFYYRQVA